MSRPLRIEYEDACYHVMNRGNQRRQVFYSDGEGEKGTGYFSASPLVYYL